MLADNQIVLNLYRQIGKLESEVSLSFKNVYTPEEVLKMLLAIAGEGEADA